MGTIPKLRLTSRRQKLVKDAKFALLEQTKIYEHTIGIKIITNFIAQPSNPTCFLGPHFHTHKHAQVSFS